MVAAALAVTLLTPVVSVSAADPGGILLAPAELAALPTSGPAWDALLKRADTPSGDAQKLATRGDFNKDVLANALVGARLNDTARKAFVRDSIRTVITAPRNVNDVLGTLRHLQTYVVAADLIQLSSFDPTFDAQFRTYLYAEIRFNYSGGGGGGSVISIHKKKANNFGTHAGATRVVADVYLGDTVDLADATKVWEGWATGDPALQDPTRKWVGTNWQADPTRQSGINVAGWTRDGHDFGGILPEDQTRCGEYTGAWPPCATNYVHGATDGMTLAFWVLARRGYPSWQWGAQAALRQYQWKLSVRQPAYSGYRWQIPVLNKVYSTTFGDADPAANSTNMGYAAWWTQ